MLNWIKNKIFNWRHDHGYYRIDELVIGGHCGLCGNWMANDIFPEIWPWGICKECVEKYGKDESNEKL